MNIAELIEHLTELAEEHGDDTPIVIVHQENYPLRESLYGVAAPADREGVLDEIFEANPGINDDEALEIAAEDEGPVEITLVAGGHPHDSSPYGSRDVWERVVR